MPLFYYQSLDVRGKKKTGHVDAGSENEAKEKLRRQGLLIISLSQKAASLSFWTQKKENELKGNHLITFTTQLSHLLSAGVPLYESLLSLEEQYRQEKFHSIILSLCDQIKGGASLSSALSQFPGSFNRLYCTMVAAGESIGALDKTLDKLSILLARQAKLKKQLTTALLYPLLLGAFSLFIIGILLTYVIPSLEAIFEGREVNKITTFVIFLSHFLLHGWMYYLPIIGITISLLIIFFRKPKGKLWVHQRLLKIPFLKNLIIQTAMARFCRTMGTLLQGGVTIINALQISRYVMRHPILEEVIEQAERRIVEGSLLSQELKRSALIPSLVYRMIAIGEEGGNSALMLQKIADVYEEETEKSLNRVTALAQPVILIVMGGVVGLIMLAVLLPLTDINAFL